MNLLPKTIYHYLYPAGNFYRAAISDSGRMRGLYGICCLRKTGLKVSRIGFGGIPIQRGSVENAEKAIFAAMDEGINFIDSARGYTVSEEYIGKALRSHRKNFILATKSMASSYETMLSDIDKSLALLNTDFIDIYQAHCVKDVETLHEFMQPGGVFDALLYAKNKEKYASSVLPLMWRRC